jgi:hypothetical protein
MDEKKCPCGKTFMPKATHQIYCSVACRAQLTEIYNTDLNACARCGSLEIDGRGSTIICGKCTSLRHHLQNKTTWQYLEKGLVLVFFEHANSWIYQPHELALHNRQLGKDVFEPSQISKKWLSPTHLAQIEKAHREALDHEHA